MRVSKVKIKVSDYIANYLAEHNVNNVFTVVGGGAMHLNDSLGHHKDIECVYNHHEQASAMAAEAYYRVNNKMACACVTSGPGAINALNGVAGAFQDSIPMIILSGQTKTTLLTESSGLPLRTYGNQEFDIVSALDKFTKFSVTIKNALEIAYYLEKAFFIAQNGRPGPVWLDVPVDIQGSIIEAAALKHYKPEEDNYINDMDSENEIERKVSLLCEKIKKSNRPVLYAGNGVRISGAKEVLEKVSERLSIPIVTCWDSIDLVASNNELYAGRAGIMGDRAGNFAVQNSDLVIAVGNRLNIYQVGYQLDSWAREAYVVDVDIDRLELEKPSIRVDLPICCDARVFLKKLLKYECGEAVARKKWIFQCQKWKEKYPVVEKRHYEEENPLNVYAFIDFLSRKLPEDRITVVANGSASVVGSAAYFIKRESRFIMNCAISSMGYELPASIGACVANDRKPVTCIAGDGSIMMNLQELQTIVTNKLPIAIFVVNNEGYQQIRLTQTNLFNKKFVGIGPQSGDLGFPNFEKLAYAFDIPYRRCQDKETMKEAIEWSIEQSGYCMVEVMVSTKQIFEPKSATKKLKDGSLYSPPLEDLAPFLSREELKENMFIKMWDEI